MITTLGFDPIMPFSIFKTALSVLLLLGWARFATVVDKDAQFYHLERRKWNALQVGAAAMGFLLLFFVPFFFLGLLLALLVIGGAGAAYVRVHNQHVSEDQQWHLDADALRAAFAGRREQQAAREARIRFRGAHVKPPPGTEDPHYQPHLDFEQIMEPALQAGAQKVEMSGYERELAAQMSVDGVNYALPGLSPSQGVAMLDYLKAQAAMDVEDRRRKQKGHASIEVEEGVKHELYLQTAGSTRGLSCSIVVDPVKQVEFSLDQLGLLDSQRKQLDKVKEEKKRVVLVASPPHEGCTSTLYALTQSHDPYMHTLHTLEPEIQRELEGVIQQEVKQDDLPRTLNSLLIREPDVVTITEVRDAETVKAVAAAGAEGHRIYAGIRANDTFSALKGWLKAVGDADQVADGLEAVVAQRLVRKLCPPCRQPYQPDPFALKKLNLPTNQVGTLYKAGGKIYQDNEEEDCPVCKGVGYKERTAAFEVMILDDHARQLIRQGQLEQLRKHLRRQKTMWLQEAALTKAVQGETSISEVRRVMGKKEQQAA